ncbi:MAG: EAL domain-containing protein [Thiotrichaceae bacterium]|nr:EAL domain-containing protein [Thiotrichaceae bacterium]
MITPKGTSKSREIAAMAEETAHRWKIMVIDDDEDVHLISKMVLNRVTYHNRAVDVISGYSGAQACQLMAQHPDVALVLLDVVMETANAGLEVVKYIREELGNQFVRIILRTGSPDQYDEINIIHQYDINDFKDKTELSAKKLFSTALVALRAFDDLKKIEALSLDKGRLEKMVAARTKDLVETNRSLDQSRARLADAQRIAQIGHWEWFVTENQCELSSQAKEILGLGACAGRMHKKELINSIPLNEREAIKNTISLAINDSISYDVTHHILRSDKKLLFVRHRGAPVINDEGETIMMIGTLQDITAQHKINEEMKKLSGAIMQTADAVMITNYSGNIEYINPSFELMTGYSSEDVIGKTPRFLKSGEQSDAFYKRMWKILHKGEIFSDVVINRRKDGSHYYEEKTITPVKDDNGKVCSFISTGRDISERMEAQQQLFHIAHHDTLTGLPNRALLQDRLTQLMARMVRNGRTVAVLFLDLDRFKIINDTLGHDVGDHLLQHVSERLVNCVRDGDTVARLGGDEFAIILNDIAKKSDVRPVAVKILEAMEEVFKIDSHEFYITTSIGIVLAPENGRDTQTLLKKADKAMYLAKESGKNRFQFYSQDDHSRDMERLSLETALRTAIKKQEFLLKYQPQIDLRSGEVSGVEALLRWQHETFKDVSPMHFIPLLEETGMIVDVGRWVLTTACEQAAKWEKEGINLRVAINLSARQFQQPDFITTVEDIIKASGVNTRLIELEITEGMLIDNIDETAKLLQQFHEMGIRIAIDDFGTGFSSMRYLKQLPLDVLKIDRCFIKDINKSPSDAAIASGIIQLAHSLELEVVAEGVEERAQLMLLNENGLDQIQGYLYSPAVSAIEIAYLMQHHKEKWEGIIEG